MGVEEVGNKGKIQSVVALDDVFRANKLATANFVGLLQHFVCSLLRVTLLYVFVCMHMNVCVYVYECVRACVCVHMNKCQSVCVQMSEREQKRKR